jgi:hypothetical protein
MNKETNKSVEPAAVSQSLKVSVVATPKQSDRPTINRPGNLTPGATPGAVYNQPMFEPALSSIQESSRSGSPVSKRSKLTMPLTPSTPGLGSRRSVSASPPPFTLASVSGKRKLPRIEEEGESSRRKRGRRTSVAAEGGKGTRKYKNKDNKKTRQHRKNTRKNRTLKKKRGKGKRTRRY